MRTKNRVSWVLSVLLFAVLLSAMLFSTKGIMASAEDPIASENWVKADTVVNVGDSMLNDDDSWNFVDGTPTKQDNTVSVGTSSLVRISNQNPIADVSYSFKMSLVASTPTAWLAYVGFRTTEYSACPWETINSGMYWLEFTHNRMALSKHVGGRNEITNASYTPGDNFFTSFHEYCISVINDENGTDVKIVVYVDGVKAIDVTDTSGVTHAGGFRVFTHNTSGGGIEQIQFQEGTLPSGTTTTDSWPNADEVLAPSDWVQADTIVNLGTLLKEEPAMWSGMNAKNPVIDGDTVTIGNNLYESPTVHGAFWYNLSGTGAYKYQDATINFKVKFGTRAEEWLMMVSFRDTVPGIANWDQNKKSAYDIQINASSIDLRRITGSTQTIATYSANGMYFLDDQFHEFAITCLNEAEGIRIYVYVDGVKAIEYLDTAPVDGSVLDSGVLLDAGAITFNSTREHLILQPGTLGHTEIKDETPPTITANLPTKGVVGEPIRLPSGMVSDDMTDPSLMFITRKVTDPDGNPVELVNREFIPTKAGEYHVVYTTVDDAGNEGKIEGTIVVSEAVKNEGNSTEKGCGSNIGSSVVIFVGLCVLTVFFIRRKEESK